MMEWKTTETAKLLDFIHTQLADGTSKKQIKRWLDSNGCCVNGQVERFGSTQLRPGDRITLTIPEKKQTECTVLFEDDSFQIIDKPPGVSVDKIDTPYPLVHRLDKDTSGVMILPKSDKAYRAIRALFEKREMKKEYLAIVDGLMDETSGTIDAPIAKTGQGEGMIFSGVMDGGLVAITHWERERAGDDWTCLRCYPETGRTHQLRVHLKHIGHPILGDYQYNRSFKTDRRPPRQLLHARRLSFTHPVTGKPVTFTAPLPDLFKEYLCDF